MLWLSATRCRHRHHLHRHLHHLHPATSTATATAATATAATSTATTTSTTTTATTATATTTTATSTTTAATASAPSPPIRCHVPRVIGATLGGPESASSAGHCWVGRIRRVQPPRRVGRVIGQRPRNGVIRRGGFPVSLVVGRR